MRYRTTILSAGKTAAGIQVPTEVLDSLGTSRKPAVKVTINGFTYRSTVATVDGRFMVGVSNDVRKAAGVVAGETVDVKLELDTEPREVVVPADFAAALDAEPAARVVLRWAVVQQQATIRDAHRRCQDGRDAPAADRVVGGQVARRPPVGDSGRAP